MVSMFLMSLLVAQNAYVQDQLEREWQRVGSDDYKTIWVDRLSRTGFPVGGRMDRFAHFRIEYSRPPAWNPRLRVTDISFRINCTDRSLMPVTWRFRDAAGQTLASGWEGTRPQHDYTLEEGRVSELLINHICS